jgi:hypothetical protein
MGGGATGIDFTVAGNRTNLLDATSTNRTGVYVSTTLTGATSYLFFAGKNGTDSVTSAINAMQIYKAATLSHPFSSSDTPIPIRVMAKS